MPTMAEDQNRTVDQQVQLRMTAGRLKCWDKAAERCGMPRTTWLRVIARHRAGLPTPFSSDAELEPHADQVPRGGKEARYNFRVLPDEKKAFVRQSKADDCSSLAEWLVWVADEAAGVVDDEAN